MASTLGHHGLERLRPARAAIIIAAALFVANCSTAPADLNLLREGQFACSAHDRLFIPTDTLEDLILGADDIYVVRLSDQIDGEYFDRLIVEEVIAGTHRNEVQAVGLVRLLDPVDRDLTERMKSEERYYEDPTYGAQSYLPVSESIDADCVHFPILIPTEHYLWLSSDRVFQKSIQPLAGDYENDSWYRHVVEIVRSGE